MGFSTITQRQRLFVSIHDTRLLFSTTLCNKFFNFFIFVFKREHMKKQHITLSSEDKKTITEFLSKGNQNVRSQRRARALQLLDAGKTIKAVKDDLQVSYVAVHNWIKNYNATGLEFLQDKPRSGRPIGISGADRAKVTALACSKPPKGYARWSLRLLADKLVELEIVESISFKQVGNILKKTSYNPTEKDNGVSAK